MIGLGSNRLTVCRRGGMSVTQAGRGGMEWLAGIRYPDWSTPYSAQATEALKAQFPTQWPTIRDYGFAHPEIVGYMNAYAQEDAKIAYSLVPTLGKIRWLKGNASAWIDSGVGTTSTTPLDITFMLTEKNNDHCGICSNGTFEIYYWGDAIEFHCSSTFNIISNNRVGEVYRLKVENNTYWFYRDGVQASTGSRNLGTQSRAVALFALNRGSASYQTKAMIANMLIGTKHFVPYKKAGVLGMIDILSGTFYPKSGGSGDFSEELTESPS